MRNRGSVRAEELHNTIGLTDDLVSPFVNQSVMVEAQQHQVRRLGLSVMKRPVLDVVNLTEPLAITTGEAARDVALLDRAPQTRGNGAATSPEIQDLAIRLEDRLNLSVTRQAASGFGGQHWTFSYLTAVAATVDKGSDVDVNRDLGHVRCGSVDLHPHKSVPRDLRESVG